MKRHALQCLASLAAFVSCLLSASPLLAGGDAESTGSVPSTVARRDLKRMRVSADGSFSTDTAMPEKELKCLEALARMPIVFGPTVFTGKEFPQYECEPPAKTRELVGKFTSKVRFFDSEYRELATPSKEGRYGAIVEASSESGLSFPHFATLCRAPGAVHWRALDVQLGPDSAEALGIDSAVFDRYRDAIEDTIKWELRSCMPKSPGAAILMASLTEASQNKQRDGQRDTPQNVDAQWWFGLKKKLGLVEHRYLERLPQDYDCSPDRKYPLILFLHGAGERGLDLDAVRIHGPHKYLLDHPELPFIVIEPQCPPDGWWNPAEVLDLLDKVCAHYRVDPERIYLTGLSMGGYGTWSVVPQAPRRFAAAVPICGQGNVRDAAKMTGTPLWVFHGAKDPVVPVSGSKEMVRAVKRAGGNVKFTLYPEAQHNSWTQTYSNPELYTWLLQHRREQGDSAKQRETPTRKR